MEEIRHVKIDDLSKTQLETLKDSPKSGGTMTLEQPHSGDLIYSLLVDSEKYHTRHMEKQYTNHQSVGISQVSLSRQMGHTTAILKLFKERANESLLITTVLNKFVRQQVPDDHWRRIFGSNVHQEIMGKRWAYEANYIMIDFCGIANSVRENVLSLLRSGRFTNLKHIFIVQ